MSRRARSSGFTLIELMFVVGIIGILTTLAVPSYTQHLYRARGAEAAINTAAIAYLEQVRVLEAGDTIACEAQPTTVPTSGVAFVPSATWRDLGFAAPGQVWFQYEVERPGPRRFVVKARADLDKDGAIAERVLDSESLTLSRSIEE